MFHIRAADGNIMLQTNFERCIYLHVWNLVCRVPQKTSKQMKITTTDIQLVAAVRVKSTLQ